MVVDASVADAVEVTRVLAVVMAADVVSTLSVAEVVVVIVSGVLMEGD